MWKSLQKFLDRFESRISLFITLGGGSAMGMITGWIASYSEWISQFGAIGWWFSGLVGALFVILSSLAAVTLRVQWIRMRAIRELSERTDSVNPLADNFGNYIYDSR